jgi:hypothetical protein
MANLGDLRKIVYKTIEDEFTTTETDIKQVKLLSFNDNDFAARVYLLMVINQSTTPHTYRLTLEINGEGNYSLRNISVSSEAPDPEFEFSIEGEALYLKIVSSALVFKSITSRTEILYGSVTDLTIAENNDTGLSWTALPPIEGGNVIIAESLVTDKLTIESSGTGSSILVAPVTDMNSTITFPDYNGTLATIAGTENLTGKTVNGLNISTTTGTLTIANGKTLTGSNTLTFTGTDGSSAAFGTGGTVAYTENKLNVFADTTASQLRAKIKDGANEDTTGTEKLVFSNSPVLTTPTLGAASATSINKVTITDPATSSILTIADGKTLTVNKTITLDGADSTTLTFGGNFTTSGAHATTFTTSGTTSLTLPISGTLLSKDGSNDVTGIRDLTITGVIKGPSTFTIDPSAHGDNTGTVVIKGDLQIDGTTTTVNSTILNVADKDIVLASGASNSAAADGAGILIGSQSTPYASFIFNDTQSSFISSLDLDLDSGRSFKIDDSVVLSATALGTEITSSSLTSVGTLTSLAVASSATTTNAGSITANSLTSGDGLLIQSTSIERSGSLLNILSTGGNPSSHSPKGATISVTNSHPGSNTALTLTASSSANNNALILTASGGINNTAINVTASGGSTSNTAINVTAGNTLLQNTTVTGSLTVSENISLTGASSVSTSTGVLTLSTAAGNGNIVLAPHGTGRILLTSGNTGTGANSAVSITDNRNMYISGNLYFPSDERLKDKHEIVSSSILDSVLATDIWKFAYKAKPDQIEIGVMAQELERNFPELAEQLVSTDSTEQFEDQKSLKESKLVYVLWAALQEEIKKRQELEEKINKIIEKLGE